MKKQMVISGINLFEGGTLSIYKDLLTSIISSNYLEEYDVTAFVHKKQLFLEFTQWPITFIELPKSRNSYLARLYYEYIYFYWWSKGKNIDVWFSVHDISPNVVSNRQYVYCHNPSPFYKADINVLKYSKSVFFMSKLYKYIYSINIKRNNGVIVQQDWIRTEFERMYGVSNIIVAHPNIPKESGNRKRNDRPLQENYSFIYASLPRVFKNFEVIFEASKRIKTQLGFDIVITLNGTENKYSRDLFNKYKSDSHIRWIGLQPREYLLELYSKSDCMIFPSKLETWGLPITEYKNTNKPILLADLPYAHETLGQYDFAAFFNPDDPDELADLMTKQIENYSMVHKHSEILIREPFVNGWDQLLTLILRSYKRVNVGEDYI